MGLRSRTALAVTLLVAYCLFALALVAVLLAVPVVVFYVLRRLPEPRGFPTERALLLFAALSSFATGVVLAWSLIPRRAKPDPTGLELFERDHPRLFEELRRLAAEVGEAMPEQVFAVMAINAGVMQLRGGRRVLVLGLPLLATYTVGELRAVVAHELGHFHRGDTQLQPWIYRTRAMIERTILEVTLGAVRAKRFWFPLVYMFLAARMPLVWFARVYGRVTAAVARAQELEADRLAATVVGRSVVAATLRKTAQTVPVVERFLLRNVQPLLKAGVVPPVCTALVGATEELPSLATVARPSGPYDAHPSLDERLAAIAPLPDRDDVTANALARGLVDDLDGLAHAYFEHANKRTYERISWADTRAHREKNWRANAEAVGQLLADVTVANINTDAAALRAMVRLFVGRDRMRYATAHGVQEAAIELLGSALMILLLDEGYDLVLEAGRPPLATRADAAIDPFQEIANYLVGHYERDAWVARWEARGLAHTLLTTEAEDEEESEEAD